MLGHSALSEFPLSTFKSSIVLPARAVNRNVLVRSKHPKKKPFRWYFNPRIVIGPRFNHEIVPALPTQFIKRNQIVKLRKQYRRKAHQPRIDRHPGRDTILDRVRVERYTLLVRKKPRRRLATRKAVYTTQERIHQVEPTPRFFSNRIVKMVRKKPRKRRRQRLIINGRNMHETVGPRWWSRVKIVKSKRYRRTKGG